MCALRRDRLSWRRFQTLALAGVAQWVEHWPVNTKVTGSIPGQGTSLGCVPGPQLRVRERQPIDVLSFSFSFLYPLSKNK